MTTHARYGEILLQFAKSIDLVDDQTFRTTLGLIESYVNKTLDVKNLVVMVDVVSDQDSDNTGDKELKKMFTDKASCTVRVKSGNEYRGQTYCAYDIGKPLWVVGKNGGLLSEEDEFIDLWSNVSDIPRYLSDTFQDAKTAIIVPIKKGGHTYGVVNYESIKILEITNEAKRELLLINDSISRLFKSSRFSRSREDDTKEAIDNLRKLLDGSNIISLQKPKIFLATPDDMKDDVIDIIRDELKKYENDVELIYWRELLKTGNIQGQIFEAIASCRYAICYLSEIATSEESRYMFKDNANVIFEAGMFHCKTNIGNTENSIWIPVREDESPPAPMDFSSQRMIIVKRNENGKVNDKEFRSEFSNRIDALLNL